MIYNTYYQLKRAHKLPDHQARSYAYCQLLHLDWTGPE